LALDIDIDFPEATQDCTRDYIEGINEESGNSLTGKLCSGEMLRFDTETNSIMFDVRIHPQSFGPGFNIAYSARAESSRITPTICDTEDCIKSSISTHRRGLEGEEEPAPIIIELDQDHIEVTSPILVDEGLTVIIRPKAPRARVVLDGMKQVVILVGAPKSHIIVSNIHFSHGYGELAHGGAVISGGKFDATKCDFTDNFSDKGGGAVYLANGSKGSRISKSRFHRNTALDGDGGAVFIEGSQLTLSSNSYTNNQCSGKGSVAFALTGELAIDSDSSYQGNDGQVFATKGSTFNILS